MADEYVIDVHGLSKQFGDHIVVNKLDMQVRRGEIFGFLGPNGSGKTTTIRMLCGLLTPDAGSGQCLGKDIFTEKQAIQNEVGYMTQRFSLYDDLSIDENLHFVARLFGIKNRTQVIEALKNRLNLQGRAQQLVGQLSGGWKQRLALAVALIHEPKMLLLDEPTAGVDPSARRQFWDKIHALSQEGITTLVSTHYMDEAERCHRIAYLAYGKLLAVGTIAEVIKQSKLITYEVSGQGLDVLQAALQRDYPSLQVVAFGATLHVSSQDQALLSSVQQQFAAALNWNLFPRNLEDVFIYLVDHAEDNFK